jgi:hypothetical protein
MTTSLAPNVDRSQPLDKEIQEQEKSMMENMKVIHMNHFNTKTYIYLDCTLFSLLLVKFSD